MIAYLDSSALVKLYAPEEGAADVRGLVGRAAAAACTSVGYIEVCSAIARREREGSLHAAAAAELRARVRADWSRLLIVRVDEDLCWAAGDLCRSHALRGFDALHVAAALTIQAQRVQPVAFACWDARLAAAASREGLEVVGTAVTDTSP